jgi:hypothetical protein
MHFLSYSIVVHLPHMSLQLILRFLLQLFQPLQACPGICQALSEARFLRQSCRSLVLLPRFTDLALHLEELAQVVRRDRTSHIAFLVPLRRLDRICLYQRSRRPLSRLFYQQCAGRGVRYGEVGGCGGHRDGVGGGQRCLLDEAGRNVVHQDDAMT